MTAQPYLSTRAFEDYEIFSKTFVTNYNGLSYFPDIVIYSMVSITFLDTVSPTVVSITSPDTVNETVDSFISQNIVKLHNDLSIIS